MDTGNSKKPFDFERFKEEAMEGLYQDKKMGGTDRNIPPPLTFTSS